MNKEELLAFWPSMNGKRYRDITAFFGTVENFWGASNRELSDLPWKKEWIPDWMEWKNNVNPDKCTQTLGNIKARVITVNNQEYPRLLAAIIDAPYALFVRGRIKSDKPMLAVVGSRNSTPVGERIIDTIISGVADTVGIVSGLARGIDMRAHEVAIQSGGYTIAVLGYGIDGCDNTETQKTLSEKIIDSGGAIVSEYPPGLASTKFSFPRRNRIIAGLSNATFVAEAGKKSGALITAQCALEYGRDVLTVPHSVFSPSGEGCNVLIKDGAGVITSTDDLMMSLKIQKREKKIRLSGNVENSLEDRILSFVADEPRTSDSIGRETNLPASAVAVALTELEIKGLINAVAGNRYKATR